LYIFSPSQSLLSHKAAINNVFFSCLRAKRTTLRHLHISTQGGQGERRQNVTFLFFVQQEEINRAIVSAIPISEWYLRPKTILNGSLKEYRVRVQVCVCVCVCVFCLRGCSSSNHKTHPRKLRLYFQVLIRAELDDKMKDMLFVFPLTPCTNTSCMCVRVGCEI